MSLKNKLEDNDYLDVLLEWGTIADIPLLIAEIRRLREVVKKLQGSGPIV